MAGWDTDLCTPSQIITVVVDRSYRRILLLNNIIFYDTYVWWVHFSVTIRCPPFTWKAIGYKLEAYYDNTLTIVIIIIRKIFHDDLRVRPHIIIISSSITYLYMHSCVVIIPRYRVWLYYYYYYGRTPRRKTTILIIIIYANVLSFNVDFTHVCACVARVWSVSQASCCPETATGNAVPWFTRPRSH